MEYLFEFGFFESALAKLTCYEGPPAEFAVPPDGTNKESLDFIRINKQHLERFSQSCQVGLFPVNI